VPNSWNGCLEAKINSVINSLRAHNFSFLCVHLETTDNASLLIVFNTFKISLINDDVAWQVVRVHTFESLHLCNHKFTVLFDCSRLDLLDESNISLPAPNEKLSLHHFDESLHEQVLNKLLVGLLVLKYFLSDLSFGLRF